MPNILYTVIIYPITQIIEFVFVFAQKLFRETGLSVICVSGIVSTLCLPLYMVAESWQEVERKIQKHLAANIAKIKAVFKGDERYMVLSTYYRQNNYHPVYAMRSTFGLLIQIPFFIAAYSYLSHLEALKGASFLFIKDLGKPDALLPIAGGINFLPIAMTFLNCAAGAVYTRGLAVKDKIQIYGMAVLFLALLYNSPSGLVLYWMLNNVFSLAKNVYFKIPFPSKRTVIYCLLSGLCTVIVFYILFVLRRDLRIKTVMASLFVCIALIPWLMPTIKKMAKKLLFRHSDRDSFFIFLFSALSISVLAGVFLPVMLIASSPQEFSHIDTYGSPLFFAANSALQTLGFFVFWPLCLYSLFSARVKKTFAAAGIVFFAIFLCNVFLFPGKYGLISIDLIFDKGVGHKFRDIIINMGILCAVLVSALFVLYKCGKKIILPVILLPFISIFGVSALNIVHIQKEYNNTLEFYVKKQILTSVEPLFSLSKTGKNTVIMMLDRATSGFIPFIFNESPDLAAIYSGFVYYPNTVSFNGYTRLGAPPIFGGYEYTPRGFNRRGTVSMREKHNEALLLLPRLFSEAGYEVTVTDPPYPNYSDKEDMRIYDQYPEIKAYITDAAYTDYWLQEHNMTLPSHSDILKRNIFWYCLLKMMPLAFREGIYQHGGWFAPFSGYKFISTLNGYSVLDYLPRLTDFNNRKENTFLFMVNNTTHKALFFQAPDYRPSLNVTDYGTSPYGKDNEYHTNIAALKRLADWFIFLKVENAYNNTRIILVSDHGAQINYVMKTSLPFNLDNVNPLLMVKDFYADGPVKTDMTFMSNADVPFLALKNQIDDARNPWTGNPITADEKTHPLYIAFSGGVHLEDPNAALLVFDEKVNYYVQDNIFVESNWVRSDK